MRRLENEDEDKFWEAWIKDDVIFCYRFGKTGSQGQTKIKKFATHAEAEAELEEKLQQKLKEGFEEPGAESEAEAESETEAESDDGEEAEEEDDEDEEEKAAPKKKPAKRAPAVAAAPEPEKATLPLRFGGHAPKPEQISALKKALEALRVGIGGRSWKLGRLARKARQACERVGGIDPAKHGLGDVFDDVMAQVIAPKKRLPLEMAIGILYELDAHVFVRVVKHWRTKGVDSPALATIGVLAATMDAVKDPEVALHAAAALADRHLSAPAWQKRFKKVEPFLTEALGEKGSTLKQYLKTLHPAGDDTLKARIEEAAR